MPTTTAEMLSWSYVTLREAQERRPQTQAVQAQSFFHSLPMDPLFCLLSQFQFLAHKTKEFNCHGSKKHRLSELLDSTLPTLSPTETAPVLVAWGITPGRMTKNSRVTKNSKPTTRYAHGVEVLVDAPCDRTPRSPPSWSHEHIPHKSENPTLTNERLSPNKARGGT